MIVITAQSNLLGNKVDITKVSKIARENVTLVMVNGVHYAPQGYSDARKIDYDFFVFST